VLVFAVHGSAVADIFVRQFTINTKAFSDLKNSLWSEGAFRVYVTLLAFHMPFKFCFDAR